MNEIVKVFNREFEGSSFATITYKGRPCWIAKDVGKALGYSDNGSRLGTNVTHDWKDDFIEGKDYTVLRGRELADFKRFLELTTETESVSSRTPNLTLLFESGLHMAAVKVGKPVGQKLRRLIVDEVLPQIVRDGAYLPEREVVDDEIVDKEIVEPKEKEAPSLADRRLALSEARERRLQRQAEGNSIKEIAELLRQNGRPNSVVLSCQIIAAERITGIDFGMLKPAIEKKPGWLTAGDIGRQLGRTAQFIASRIRKLGYGDGTVYCRPVMGLKGISILGSKVIDIKYYDPRIIPAVVEACIQYDKFRGIDEDQKVLPFPPRKELPIKP